MTGWHGEFYRRGEAGYEQSRTAAVWNERKPERYPDAIVIARDEDDVVAAVHRAKEQGSSIGIRSGGTAGSATASATAGCCSTCPSSTRSRSTRQRVPRA